MISAGEIGRRISARLQLKRLEAFVAWRWRIRRKGKPHALPGPLVVSLTSYPKRFDVTARTLQCLLTQTVQPDRVVLWVAHQDYPLLPPSILALQDDGLEIRETKDYKAYKKIIPSLEAFPNAYVCTADDDLYYEARWLEKLTEEAAHAPDLITCFRAHEIAADNQGAFLPYDDWHLDTAFRGISPALFPTGCGGILYPPGALAPEVCDAGLFMRLCPQNDDIWLFWMARRAGTRHKTIAQRHNIVCWAGSQEVGLYQYNVMQHGNDTQIQAMAAEFGYPAIRLRASP